MNEYNIIEGKLDLVSNRHGYLLCDISPEPIIQGQDLGNALHGDTVKVELRYGDGRPCGKIIEIIERKTDVIYGHIIDINSKWALLQPHGKYRWSIKIPMDKNIQIGTYLKISITDYPTKGKNKYPIGKIVFNYGLTENSFKIKLNAIKTDHNVPISFPNRVLSEASKIKFNIKKTDYETRRNFIDDVVITIDPTNSKDFDDAISYRLYDNYEEIGIHIADVSHFVELGSKIDIEARKRAYTMYLCDEVVPMLPNNLSEDFCSLNPDVERFAFSCVIKLINYKIVDVWFGKTIIKSKRRYDYDTVEKILMNNQRDKYEFELKRLFNISTVFREERKDNQAILLSTTEVYPKFFNDKIKIITKNSLNSNHLVEEYMLLANKLVAEKIMSSGYNGIYRIHKAIEPNKLNFIQELNISLHKKSIEEQNYLKPYADEIHSKCMSKAIYSITPGSHYGLKMDYYTHFTSPIRRYSDLMTHRILQTIIDGNVDTRIDYLLEDIVKNINNQEQNINELERIMDRICIFEWAKENVKNSQWFGVVISEMKDYVIVKLPIGIEVILFEKLKLLDQVKIKVEKFDENRKSVVGVLLK